MRVAEAITLSPDERTILDKWATGRSFPFRVVQRAQIIRMAADGVLSQVIARTLRISRPTVQLWRQRFLALRLPGLEKDAPRPGRIPRISHRKVSAVIHATWHSTPPNATHWSARSLAKAQGLSKDAIHRIWKQYNRKPLSLRKSLSISLRLRYMALSYCQGCRRLLLGGMTGM